MNGGSTALKLLTLFTAFSLYYYPVNTVFCAYTVYATCTAYLASTAHTTYTAYTVQSALEQEGYYVLIVPGYIVL